MAVFVLFDLGFILPSQVSQLRNARKESAELRKKIESLEQDLSNKTQFVQKRDKLMNVAEESQARFVSENDASFIMAEINRIAKDLGINLVSIQPKSLRKKGSRGKTEFYYLPFIIQLNSKYHDLGRFLNSIEGLDFSLVLKEMIVTGTYPDNQVTLELCGVVKK